MKVHCKGRLLQRYPDAVWPCKSVCTVRRDVCRNLNNKSLISFTHTLFIMPVLNLSRHTVYTVDEQTDTNTLAHEKVRAVKKSSGLPQWFYHKTVHSRITKQRHLTMAEESVWSWLYREKPRSGRPSAERRIYAGVNASPERWLNKSVPTQSQKLVNPVTT
jgi:hypothetical protein